MRINQSTLDNIKELVKDEKYRMPRDITLSLIEEILYYRNRESKNRDLGITEGAV